MNKKAHNPHISSAGNHSRLIHGPHLSTNLSFLLYLFCCPIFAVADSATPTLPPSLPQNISCGALCLYQCARILGVEANLDELNKALSKGPVANSFLAIQEAATSLGLYSLPMELSTDDLLSLPYVSIASIVACENHEHERSHFVVVAGKRENSNSLVILDAPSPPLFTPVTSFANKWTGHVLVLSKDPIDINNISPHNLNNTSLFKVLTESIGLPGKPGAYILILSGFIAITTALFTIVYNVRR